MADSLSQLASFGDILKVKEPLAPYTILKIGGPAEVLALPFVFIVPGLATLGVTDTWLEFRRRFPGRPHS